MGGVRITRSEDKFVGKMRDAASKLMAKDGNSKSLGLKLDILVTASIAYVMHRKRSVVENEDILDSESLGDAKASIHTPHNTT